MSILQIAKIQHRSGNLVDLPQLDEAEFGWASDAKRLFIGKTTPNENVEVLTSYSTVSFSQIDGSVGNININPATVENGQPLVFDGENWVNRGGDAGGLITLGTASNVKLDGGALGYVLQTDGLGNLSWTPKAAIVAYIENVTKANPAVVTTTEDNYFTDGVKVTITDPQGMSDIAGQSYYANVLTSNTFALYNDDSLTIGVDSSTFNAYSYTSVSATTSSTNEITVSNSAPFSLNSPVRFTGNISANSGAATTNISTDVTYYVKTKPNGTTLTISYELLANGAAGNTLSLGTASSLSANVYQEGGRIVTLIGGSNGGVTMPAAGVNTCVQFNNNNIFGASADFTFDSATNVLTVNGNVNTNNINTNGNITAQRFLSNIATGTTPIQVISTTRVPNLNVSYANVSDYGVVTTQNNGTYYPTLVNGNTTANYALASNSNLSFDLATGQLNTNILVANGNITSNNISTSNNVTVGNVLTVSGNVELSGANVALGDIANLHIDGGTDGYVLATDGSGVLSFIDPTSIITEPAGSNTQVQFNDDGTMAGDSALTFDKTTSTLDIGGNLSVISVFAGQLSVTSSVDMPDTANIGNATIASNLTASGNVSLGNVSITSDIDVSGNAIIAGNVSANNVSAGGNVDVAGNIAVLGSSTVNGNSTVTGNTAINGNLTVSSVTTLLGDTNLGNLVTTGLARFDSNLVANGNITINSPNMNFNGTRVNFGSISNVKISGGSSGQLIQTDGTGNLAFVTYDPSAIVNGTSNVRVLANGNITFGSAGTSNIVVISGQGANITGTLSVIGNTTVNTFIANTALITSANIGTINSSLLKNGNSNVTINANANIALTAKGNTILTVSDTGAFINGVANVSGNTNIGNLNASGLVNVIDIYSTGNVFISKTLDVTGNAILGNLNTTSVVASGNVSGANIVSTGTITTSGTISGANLTVASNAAIANLTSNNATIPNLTSNIAVIATGNISTINSGLLRNGNSNITIVNNDTITLTAKSNAIAVISGTGTTLNGNITFNSSRANLGDVSTVKLYGGSNGYALVTDGTGNLSFQSYVPSIGINQTWQNITISRQLGVNYTNTTGRSIMVYAKGSAGNGAFVATVNSIEVASGSAGNHTVSVNFLVPPGAVYRVTGSGVNLVYWSELR